MSFTPNPGTVVRLSDGRIGVVSKATPSGDDWLLFSDGHEEQSTAWTIEEMLTDEPPPGTDPATALANYIAVS